MTSGSLNIVLDPLSINRERDASERILGRWKGDLPVWLCNLFATILPFYSCTGEMSFFDDGSISTDDMTLSDIEGGRTKCDSYLKNVTWEISNEDSDGAFELVFRYRYEGIPLTEHYVAEFRRSGRSDLLVVYDLEGRPVAKLRKVR